MGSKGIGKSKMVDHVNTPAIFWICVNSAHSLNDLFGKIAMKLHNDPEIFNIKTRIIAIE